MVTAMGMGMVPSSQLPSARSYKGCNSVSEYILTRFARVIIPPSSHQFFREMVLKTILVAVFSAPAFAQTVPTTQINSGRDSIAPAFPSAQTAASTGFRIVPSLELTERYSDNISLAGTALAQSDWLTTLSPGVSLEYRAARANALLDFRLSRLIYQSFSNLDNTQRRLLSTANIELIEKWLFIDARASTAQQNRSVFGAAEILETVNARTNRIETTTYQISPSIRGNFFTFATYQARLSGTETRAGDNAFPNTTNYDWSATVRSAVAGPIKWSMDANGLSTENGTDGRRRDSRLRGTAAFEFDAQFRPSILAGQEISNLNGAGDRTTTIAGIGIEWLPSNRTRLSAAAQRRFFGNDHRFEFSHRTPLTVWRIVSTKDVIAPTTVLSSISTALADSNQASPSGGTGINPASPGTNSISDPVLSPVGGIQNGSLIVRPYLSRRADLSLSLVGARNTVTLSANRREQRAIDSNRTVNSGAVPIEETRQIAASLSWAYRFSPISTMRVVLSRSRTDALFIEGQTTTQQVQSIFYDARLGLYTFATVGLQRNRFDSTVAASFRENAFVSTLIFRF